MGHSRHSSEERKANQEAHEARMAQFTRAEAEAKARRAAAEEADQNGQPAAQDQEETGTQQSEER